MSGHNKWSTIKHKKGAADAKRGKIFSKLAREIIVAVREGGGGDPESNPALRTIIQNARGVNMPMDNITRAIKKATGEGSDAVQYEELAFEGYAADGVGLIIEVLTDNRNRAAAEIKHAFNRYGANLAQTGSVSRNFARMGEIFVARDKAGEDALMEQALEAGAEDMEILEDEYRIVTDPSDCVAVADAITKAGIEVANSGVNLVALVTAPVTEKSKASSLMKFIDALEDLDDVRNVYSNYDISDELLEEIGAEE
jgi:YebC/PmpR family DNA-binding regulatory protein